MLFVLGVVYLDVLEEFRMSIPEEEMIRYSNKTDAGLLNSQVSREIDSLVRVYHLATCLSEFTLLHFLPSVCILRMSCHHWSPRCHELVRE
jgi:hypothetical protein